MDLLELTGASFRALAPSAAAVLYRFRSGNAIPKAAEDCCSPKPGREQGWSRVAKRFFLNAIVGAALSGIVVGCASNPYSPLSPPEAMTEISTPPQLPPEIVTVPREPVAVMGLDHVDAASLPLSTTNVSPAKPTMSFGTGWISLREWTDRCALGAPDRGVAGGTTTYRITTRGGVCKLTIGSRLAQWNGTSVWLGFAPQIIHGEPRIHALDAEKNLMPLATMVPVPKTKTRTIVLDPGHGGSDGGTRGGGNELEKNYTLDWALRTERLLTNAGWRVFLTRRSDVDASLSDRIAVADRVHADLFISLHFNSTFPQTQPSGIETYCLTPTGAPSTLARGYFDDERAVFPNNAFDAANMEWAFRVHRSLLDQTQAHDDGIKRARFMGVLRYQGRPAILVEGGFLSNLRDAANIKSETYRESLARAVANALK